MPLFCSALSLFRKCGLVFWTKRFSKGFPGFIHEKSFNARKKLRSRERATRLRLCVRTEEHEGRETKQSTRRTTDRYVSMRTRSFLALALALVLSVATTASRADASEGADGALSVVVKWRSWHHLCTHYAYIRMFMYALCVRAAV